MPRNSEIDRAGMGSRVLELARDENNTAPMIAAAISEESGKTFSTSMIHRHIQKTSLNASITNGEHRAIEMLAAAISGIPSTRDSADPSATYFGRYKLDTTNIFDRYYAIAREVSGQVESAFINLALKVSNGANITGDEKDEEKIEALMADLNFSSLLQDVARSTCEMGTCVVLMRSSEGEDITPQISPMSYITLLPDSETVGVVGENLVHGTVTRVIHDEMGVGKIEYTREDVGLFRLWAGANYFTDIAGRPTFSIYGRSKTIGVETPLKSFINASYYYDEFIKRYGMGRLHINMKLLADMLKDKTITSTAAKATQDTDAMELQKIGPNEDIISTGREISMIESKQGFNIIPYLELREKQINRALLQSDVASGEVGGTWTSAGTAVSAQELVALQSLRDTIFKMFTEEIIEPRLEYYDLDPSTISIMAEPLSQAPVPYQVLTDWADRGYIAESELRVRGGFSQHNPDEV
jgi:hypothetical protein